MNPDGSDRAVVACLDVGSPMKGTVGWAIVDGPVRETGVQLQKFAEALSLVLLKGRRVSVGFECPLFVPRRSDPMTMTSARRGEKGQNWCGGPGGSVLATGLVQVNWILTSLVAADARLSGTTRWREFAAGLHRLHVWEAYITSSCDPVLEVDGIEALSPHVRDALCGASAFVRKLDNPEGPASDFGEEAAASLIGFNLLQSGLSTDLSLLSESCLVLTVRKPVVDEGSRPALTR